jgi:hypothetical protein
VVGRRWDGNMMLEALAGITQQQGSGAFAPTDISGLEVWLDSQDASTYDGTTPITAWRDKSGNDNDYVSLTGFPNYAASEMGSYSAMVFVNPNGYAPISTIGDDITVFFAFRLRAQGGGQLFNVRDSSNGTPLFDDNSRNGFGARRRNDAGSLVNTGNATKDLDPHITRHRFEGNGGVFNFWIDGVKSGGSDATAVGTTTGLDRFGFALINCAIGELIVYNTKLSDAHSSDVETFMADKWGITI